MNKTRVVGLGIIGLGIILSLIDPHGYSFVVGSYITILGLPITIIGEIRSRGFGIWIIVSLFIWFLLWMAIIIPIFKYF
ncbi:hypothetical protein AKJ45_00720 [candidate division MSBL1 archaeon SCGC-AAA261F19]|uniref:Uncharacterized protein n=1 Tax=candidate division MSBL1 archaeon SCGC-AAA261F19 TaxID=1698275 RepID=A0A133VBC0_9EURY|nr:hypothetical protein AKJ45_00720 [candidate division MSBL1 archaeon SCGC-AAA261F19]